MKYHWGDEILTEKELNEHTLKAFNGIRPTLGNTYSIAFDGCHKVYLIPDLWHHREMHDLGYEVKTVTPDNHDEIMETLWSWFGEESCPLRFITRITSDYESVIPQVFWDDSDECDYTCTCHSIGGGAEPICSLCGCVWP